MLRLGVDGRELTAATYTGIGRYVSEVLRAAGQSGWECIVYSDGELTQRRAFPGVTLRRLPGRWTPWWDQVCLPRALSRDGVSVFLSPYYKGPLVAPCPVVVTTHDLFFIRYLGRRRLLYDTAIGWAAWMYARRATAIITDSEYSKRAIIVHLGVEPAKVTVIPIAAGTEFKPTPLCGAIPLRYGIKTPYILYVGNFSPHKNLPRLLRAYAQLPRKLLTSYDLVLAGGDIANRPRLEGLVYTLGLSDRVRFPGPIEDADLPALYSGCALFLLVSLEEGFGLPALEAMACGAPVVASNRAALPEVVGQAGILVDPEDEAAITEAMLRVLATSEVRATLRHLGLTRAREFCPARTSERLLALLREVSESNDVRV